MENHPIPQDVTGFQFKLIGNMTIKQFAYLASGAVLAWLFFASPITVIIKLPLAFLFGFSGFCLAFLPVDGRPMDSMLLYFFKALFSPNQYIFQRAQTHNVILASDKGARPGSEPTDSGVAQLPRMTEEVTPVLQPTPQPEPQPKPEPEPVPEPIKEIVALPPVARNDKEEDKANAEYQTVLSQLAQTQQENLRLAQELEALKQTLAQTQQQTQAPSPQPSPLEGEGTASVVGEVGDAMVKKVAPSAAQQPGVPMPTDPNVLVGIVKDPRGNVLPNILVEVKDKDGNPVRAFKTNALGQFASATSLVSGVYTLEFDDPEGKQKFDALELTLQGEIIGPIVAISVDQREELRRSLFPTS